ncbi:unnamed protein product [Lampetra fluviatilis]
MPGTDGSFASVASEPGQGCAFYLVAGPAETLLHCADVAGTSSVQSQKDPALLLKRSCHFSRSHPGLSGEKMLWLIWLR